MWEILFQETHDPVGRSRKVLLMSPHKPRVSAPLPPEAYFATDPDPYYPPPVARGFAGAFLSGFGGLIVAAAMRLKDDPAIAVGIGAAVAGFVVGLKLERHTLPRSARRWGALIGGILLVVYNILPSYQISSFDLLELIMRRYERASTLLTSNRPVDD